jgi:hypothetical protein
MTGDALLLFPPEERKPRSFTTVPAASVAAADSNASEIRRRWWVRPVRIRIAVAAPRVE